MKRLFAHVCLGLACLIALPTVANAQFANKRTVKTSKKKTKRAKKRTPKRVKRRATRKTVVKSRKPVRSTRTVRKTRTKVVTTSKPPSRLKSPPGRRAPRTRAPRGRGYRGDRGYRGGYYGGRRRGYNNGYRDGYDDARYRERRRGGGGSTGGQSAPRRESGPPMWSGGLLLGGAGGETTFDQTEHETSLGFFGELNLRGVVARNVSVGIHGGLMHNEVQSTVVDSVRLGSVGADMAVHLSRGRNSPYLRGGVGFAHATLDPTDAFAPEATGGGWYAKAGVGVSLGMLLIEGNCTQYNFDDLAIPGGPGKESEIFRCGVGLGFGR